MSTAIPAIIREDSHVAAGHGFGIGLYIAELEAMGLSPEKVRQSLADGGLSVVPPPRREPSCLQIEQAVVQLDYYGAVNALCAFRKTITEREARMRQLQCLRMRIEYRHGESSKACQMLLRVLRT